MSNRKKPSSPLRQALAKKTSLRTYFDFALVDVETVERVSRKLQAARQLEHGAMLSDNPDVKTRAAAVLAEIEAERDACFHRIWFRGLGSDEWDALVDLHPPTPEQAKDGAAWNDETFNYGLLEATAIDSDLSADDWRRELADEKWTNADRRQLVLAAVRAQRQTLADQVPKD